MEILHSRPRLLPVRPLSVQRRVGYPASACRSPHMHSTLRPPPDKTGNMPPEKRARSLPGIPVIGFLLALLLSGTPESLFPSAHGQQDTAQPEGPPAFLIPVSLPLRGDADMVVRGQLERRLNELPAGGERPVLVLEFRAAEGSSTQGSQFERALSLARFLTSDRMSRVRTVAYLPGSVVGHAVLPVLACEELVVAEDAELGDAGRGEEFVDAAMRESYQKIAELRRTIPSAVALGMLDRSLEVFRVETLDGGVRFVTSVGLEELQSEGQVSKVETVVGAGDLARLSGRQLRLQYGFASQIANSRSQLSRALNLPRLRVGDDVAVGSDWTAVQVDLVGRVHSEQVTRIIRMLQDRIRKGGGVLIVLRVDSPGGSPVDSLRLADFFAGLDRSQTRTLAFVDGYARSDAAIPVLACQDVAVIPSARLGGPGDRHLRPADLADLKPSVQQLAKRLGREWSPMMAMLDPQMQVYRYQRGGSAETRLLGTDELAELEDSEDWIRGELIQFSDGLSAGQARQLNLVRYESDGVESLLSRLDVEPKAERLEAGWLITRIERLAAQTWFSRTLLFIAFFALISEASAPGLGVPGFISAFCFLLFFWAQFLNGTAGWLEVLLFLGGLACIAMEIFVLPGFGVFGIGGAMMMIASIILASQTFVIPQNAYQLQQLPRSLFTLIAAGFGGVAALGIMSRYMGQTPLLRHLMLAPPREESREELDRRESVVDFSHLLHKPGVAITRLSPAGKARFGEEMVDVISEGDLIPAEARIHVTEVLGNRIVVRPVDEVSGMSETY
jgi:membrane-bound serine protease (ClpP class)